MFHQVPREKLDKLQLMALAGLMFLGAAFVCSATTVSEAAALLPWWQQLWVKQVVWYAIGLAGGAAVCFVDYHTIARWADVVYWTMIVCLLLVLVPHIGSIHGGARRWIELKVFQFQPSEFAKLTFIIAMANFLSRPPNELKSPEIFWKSMGLMLLPFALIFKEPDLGSALVLLPTGLVMMLVAGTPRGFLVKLGVCVGVLGMLFLADVLFAPRALQLPIQDYQRQRLLVYFGRDFSADYQTKAEKEAAREAQRKSSYQGQQALISVGSGGLLGKGWHQGSQTALGFLPPGAAHNDFIFSVIAEEEGFAGSLAVLALYAAVLFTGLRTAGRARDRLGKLLAVGVVTLIFCHVFINIGMNIRIVPVTGIPLPLLSYGGSSVLCSLIALGLMQNIHIHRKGY